MRKLLFVLIVLLGKSGFSQEIPVKFEIDNLRNDNGNVIVSVYKDAKSFDEGIPEFRKTINKKENMENGSFKAQVLLPPGVYGLVFLDDENNDGAMNNSFIGVPKEGFGFSNFYLPGFKKPKFSDFSFTLTENTETMQVKLRYL
ncbi:MAG TPA: DUF2141 domain-containing protein [Tangfeifania sp.]|nr:DUF2141 domain-containing protein [Tangfeifania sp.]